ncbi:MAG TPA: hypothetical protein VN673_02635 [Clostridia bacterium]|nr:hypothetical protein [Clostridia bacterium]
MPAPSELAHVVQPPLSHCWGEALAWVKTVVENAEADWKGLVPSLQGI